MMRSKMLGLVATAAAGLATATAANAAPFGYGPPEAGAVIERVAGGCGPGLRRAQGQRRGSPWWRRPCRR